MRIPFLRVRSAFVCYLLGALPIRSATICGVLSPFPPRCPWRDDPLPCKPAPGARAGSRGDFRS
jgi:hypothetical protein